MSLPSLPSQPRCFGCFESAARPPVGNGKRVLAQVFLRQGENGSGRWERFCPAQRGSTHKRLPSLSLARSLSRFSSWARRRRLVPQRWGLPEAARDLVEEGARCFAFRPTRRSLVQLTKRSLAQHEASASCREGQLTSRGQSRKVAATSHYYSHLYIIRCKSAISRRFWPTKALFSCSYIPDNPPLKPSSLRLLESG